MNVKSRQSNIVVQSSGDETLIYDLAINKAFLLNETAAFVWKSLDGKTDIKTVAYNLSRQSKSMANEEIVWLAIETLRDENLLENPSFQSPFKGIARRDVIKRAGLATMIALPFISSITAPRAINAASAACIPVDGDCVDLGNYTQSNCCSGLRCLTGGGFCLACRTSSDAPYIQLNSLAACQSSSARNLCCNPTASVTFVPGSPGSCFCG